MARRALIVANGRFEDKRIPRLQSPVSDGERLANLLRRPDVGPYTVEFLADLKTQEVKLASERFFKAAGPDDLLLLFLSGHGMKDRKGNLYFVTRETQPDALASTAVEARFFHDMMRDSLASKLVVFVDTCYSGAFAEGSFKAADLAVDQRDFSGDEDVEGTAIFTAAARNQLAEEKTDELGKHQSRFTRALIEGIETGAADPERTGVVTLDNLFRHARAALKREGAAQTPQQLLAKLPGSVAVARNPIADVDLPEALRADLESGDRVKRVAAVDTLVEIASSKDKHLARRAETVLKALALDETVSVSTAARRGLEKLGLVSNLDVDEEERTRRSEEGARLRAEEEARRAAEEAALRKKRAEIEQLEREARAREEAELERRRREIEAREREAEREGRKKGGGIGRWVAGGVAGLLGLAVVGQMNGAEPEPEPPFIDDGGEAPQPEPPPPFPDTGTDAAPAPPAPTAGREERIVSFARGATQSVERGAVSGAGAVDFLVRAKAGQELEVALASSHPGLHFDLFPAGGGSTPVFKGREHALVLPSSGAHRIRVHFYDDAAARGERADFALSIAVDEAGAAPPLPAAAFPRGEPPLAGQLRDAAAAMGAQLPMAVPGVPGMVVQSVEARGTTLTFMLQSAEVMPAEMMGAAQSLAQAIAERDCAVPVMRQIVEAGGTLVYRFRFLDGRYVDGVVRNCARAGG